MTKQPQEKKKGGARLTSSQQNPKRTTGSADYGRDSQKRKREKIVMTVMIIIAVIMVLGATVAVLYVRWVKKPTLPSSEEPSASAPLPPDEDSTFTDSVDFDPMEPKVSGTRKSEDFYTILVFGSDVTSGLTDTIMVVSYDISNQKATVMSIPRDTLVNVKSSYKLINGVYNAGGKDEAGTQALKNEVSELIGFMPDYYIMIDWELVGQMVDAIGGVDYDVPYHMGYDDPTQDLHIHFEPGLQHLDGEEAMNLVRWRKNNDGTKTEGGGGDVSRLEVQHDFLKTVLKQTLKLSNVTKVGELAELFGENVVSDLSVENLFWFASQAIMGGLDVENVNFVTMPYLGVGSGTYGGRVYPDQDLLLELINESLNPFETDVTIKQLDLIRVSADGNSLSSSTGRLADSSAAATSVTTSSTQSSAEPSASAKPSASSSPTPSAKQSSSPKPSESPKESTSPKPSESPKVSASPKPSTSVSPSASVPPSESVEPEPSQETPTEEPDPPMTEPVVSTPEPGSESGLTTEE